MKEDEIQDWHEFARGLKKRARWDVEKVDRVMTECYQILSTLERDERTALLEMDRVVAERSSKFAITFLGVAPKALKMIDPSCRKIFLGWARIFASQSRETLIEFLEESKKIIAAIPEKKQALCLDLGQRLAVQNCFLSFKYFLALPRIANEISNERISEWFEQGLPLIHKNLPEAMAYYALESRHSREHWQEGSSAVFLQEVARPLKLFAQALTGRSLGLRSSSELRVPLPYDHGFLPCTDGESLYLPEVSQDFSSSALNFSAYKLTAAQQSGYVEFGTFRFKLSTVHDLFPLELWQASLQAISSKGKAVSPLEAFFQLFPRKNLAMDLFHLLEGARVHHCLRREYPGLKREMDLLIHLSLQERPVINSLPLQEAVLEYLLRMALLEGTSKSFLWPIDAHREELRAILNPILQKESTVRDSARGTVVLYRWLASLPNIPWSILDKKHHADLLPAKTILMTDGMEFAPRLAKGENAYQSLSPLFHWGQLRPELVQKKLRLREVQGLLKKMEMGIPLSAEALRKLLEQGMELEVEILRGEEEGESQGLFLTDLHHFKGSLTPAHRSAARTNRSIKSELNSLLAELEEESGDGHYYYDEWDYLIRDYRVKWCRLREKEIEAGSSRFVGETLEAYADLVSEVRRQFQMLKPERFKKIPHLERGEEVDLNAAVEAAVDRRAGHSPSEKIYIERNRLERDFSTLFLLDMSASTDERIPEVARPHQAGSAPGGNKRVIDIEKEALVVMAEALDEIGDEYAVFGFSGYGRRGVDFFTIKDFSDRYGEEIKKRIGGIKPQRSTRMGPAIRHAVERMAGREPRIKNIILISDGYPQDYDYGEDRSGKEYALQDTMMALEEAARNCIHTFCITVDRSGHDYLRKMCHPSRYLVIEETAALPRELTKIYRRLTT